MSTGPSEDAETVEMPARAGPEDEFRFMGSAVSGERPKARLIADCALAMKAARQGGKRVLFVGGPAIVHGGSGAVVEQLVRDGWIDTLFAGNALAAHDIEALCSARRWASISSEAWASSMVTSIISAPSTACVVRGRLPRRCARVCSRAASCTRALRVQSRSCLPARSVTMGRCPTSSQTPPPTRCDATTLHGIATGNMLRADVATYCVDASAETVIKLVDRGTHQAIGIVTDCAYFLNELARVL